MICNSQVYLYNIRDNRMGYKYPASNSTSNSKPNSNSINFNFESFIDFVDFACNWNNFMCFNGIAIYTLRKRKGAGSLKPLKKYNDFILNHSF